MSALFGLGGLIGATISLMGITILFIKLIERAFMRVRLCVWIAAPNRGEIFSAPFSIIV